MNLSGIIIGLTTFLAIGLFHPIVIKAEYYFGKRCWWVFLMAGVVFLALSLLCTNLYGSIILGVVAFSSFWSIGEIFVIGGGVSKAGDVLIPYIEKNFTKYVFHASRGTKFALAKLGNDAGIYGSAKLVLD